MIKMKHVRRIDNFGESTISANQQFRQIVNYRRIRSFGKSIIFDESVVSPKSSISKKCQFSRDPQFRRIDNFDKSTIIDGSAVSANRQFHLFLSTDMTLLFIETRDIPESGSIFPFSPVNKNRVKSSVKIVFRLKYRFNHLFHLFQSLNKVGCVLQFIIRSQFH